MASKVRFEKFWYFGWKKMLTFCDIYWYFFEQKLKFEIKFESVSLLPFGVSSF